MILSEYLANWDPMGFIEDLDTPDDEYSYEAAEIVTKFKPEMSVSEIADLVYEVFNTHIGVDESPNFKQECVDRAEEIRKVLIQG